jgi:hypothetical protein
MAFPGSYDFIYYKGDTLEFRVYPKDASGAAFNLSGYTPTFTIATRRGLTSSEERAVGYTKIVGNESYILCAIPPQLGNRSDFLIANSQYVYDIQILNPDADGTADDADETNPSLNTDKKPYDYVYTLLTGTITVRDQVTGAL